jgi:tricorn protease
MRLMVYRMFCAALAVAASIGLAAQRPTPATLFQSPTVNRTHIVFGYAGDLWSVPRGGGEARRLTNGTGVERNPIFSPDGQTIAFTGEYEGNADVYTVPATGGVPKRLTYHPGTDEVAGWTPDGKSVLFRSARWSSNNVPALFIVSRDGGFPEQLPLPEAFSGSFSPDGKRIAYTPLPPAFTLWKRYRGGRTSSIAIASLDDSSVQFIPRDNSNDFAPMWVDDRVYFLSDRSGSVRLYSYDVAGRKVAPVNAVNGAGFDLKSASAGAGVVAYEQFGAISLYDVKTGKSEPQTITLAGDLPEVRQRYVNGADTIRNAGLSPTGVRAVFETHGDILTVPAEKGDVRNLTGTPGAYERFPAWSPDGQSVAYFSDESGEYQLCVRDQAAATAAKCYAAAEAPTFFYRPVWSPDSKRIAYTDKRLNLWYLSVGDGKIVRVATDRIFDRQGAQNPVWSPGSEWLAYTLEIDNRLTAVFLYSLASGKSTQVTDGMSDADYAAFDKSGKYLFFTASTDVGPILGNGLSTLGRTFTRSAYVVVLRNDLPSPLAPESDDEKAPSEPKPAADRPAAPPSAAPAADRIDLDGIQQRIVAMPIPPRPYTSLVAGKAGVIFIGDTAPPNLTQPGPPQQTLYRYDLTARKEEKVAEGLSGYAVAYNGEKILLHQQTRWTIVPAMTPPKPGEGALRLDALDVRVDPQAEWRQMYHEVWRGERDFFYSPQFHGLDLKAAESRYLPYLEAAGSRSDVMYVFAEMLGELTVSHMFVGGPPPPPSRVRGGLLGADYRIENGRYRFARVLNGESWNPQLRAPLTQPGATVAGGEYLLAIDGLDVRPPQDIDARLEGRANRSVRLSVGADPSGAGAREVSVVPTDDERALRNRAWIEENRRKVDQMSNGRIAYVYLPDTSFGGYVSFNRYFFSQLNKQAVLLDERYNGGGALADYVVDYLRRPLLNFIHGREGADDVMPFGAIFGPKVMLMNEYAGSGGDAVAYYFKKMGVGPLMGKRTWGGLVRNGAVPLLMDGTRVSAPDAGIWSESGEWVAENTGVAPDIEVAQDPAVVRKGHDPQLERAVAYLLDEMKKAPAPKYTHPPFKDYQKGTKP